jgi:hypothetical protein
MVHSTVCTAKGRFLMPGQEDSAIFFGSPVNEEPEIYFDALEKPSPEITITFSEYLIQVLSRYGRYAKASAAVAPLGIAYGFFGFNAYQKKVVASFNAILQMSNYIFSADASAISKLLKEVFTDFRGTLKSPSELLKRYHHQGTNWTVLSITMLGFILRVQGAGMLFLNAIYDTLKENNPYLGLSLGAILGALQEVTIAKWEGDLWFFSTIEGIQYLRNFIEKFCLNKVHPKTEHHNGYEAILDDSFESTLATEFATFLQEKTNIYDNPVVEEEPLDPFVKVLSLILNENFIEYCKVPNNARALRHEFYARQRIDRKSKEGREQWHFIKALVLQATQPNLIANIKKMLAVWRPEFINLITVDDHFVRINPFNALTDFVSHPSFKKSLWADPKFVEFSIKKAREFDAVTILDLLKRYGTIDETLTTDMNPQQIVQRILSQHDMWKDKELAPEKVAAVKKLFGNIQDTALQPLFKWNDDADKKAARDLIYDYLSKESAEILVNKIYISEDTFFPRSKPSAKALWTSTFFTEAYFFPYQLTILASNMSIIYNLAEFSLGTDEASDTGQYIINLIALIWGYLQLVLAIWGLSSKTFGTLSTDIDKVMNRSPSYNTELLLFQLKHHPLIIGLCLLYVLSTVSTWYNNVKTLNYPEPFAIIFGIISLISGLITYPTLTTPRLVEVSKGVPTKDDKINQYLLDHCKMTDEDKKTIEQLNPECRRTALYLYSSLRPDRTSDDGIHHVSINMDYQREKASF